MIKNSVFFGCASFVAMSMSLVALPTTANAGFLEQLFGVAPSAPQVAVPEASAPMLGNTEHRYFTDAPVHHRAKKRLVIDGKPKLQKPTDLMHDATLQSGDAIMMRGGLRVYTGSDRETVHEAADFEPLGDVQGVSKQQRIALAALDATNVSVPKASEPSAQIVSGRSAASMPEVSEGRAIVDARGMSVRYVGP